MVEIIFEKHFSNLYFDSLGALWLKINIIIIPNSDYDCV